ncbi:MAG: octanoyltransferase [Betaproteobacteria bacterium RIFCSPLOWO2_12_FULL_63_13]|nr:MAG: octanoyltransferase [Betaproteobacteria bacterium RIFCSPLOWO2_02_FULL_63_19]OGA42960.1 MAG: octanoyltransferase [Betaproteobacteria bacterium RIFCSPLOWO2_12_FULL_63_13]
MKLRRLGLVDYAPTYDAMRRFTEERSAQTDDELWILQHRPVYTVGVAGRIEHYPRQGPVARSVPVQRIDRGGQITYHGPGQAIVYTLLDLARNRLTVRSLVRLLEQSVIDCLADYNVPASRRTGAPGIYVDSARGAKVAALGLRVRRGCCYHGVALNVDMDLEPFAVIDPCGYPGLAVTQTSALGVSADTEAMGEALARRISQMIESPHAAR